MAERQVTIIRRAALALGAALAFAGALFSASLGVADLLATDARQFLRDVEHPLRPVTHERWAAAVDGLQQARHMHPWSAAYTADLARLYLWQSWQQVSDRDASDAYARASAISLRRAVSQRPSWGYAWAELADGAAIVDGLSQEVAIAYARASVLAPYERRTLRRQLWLGVPAWSAMDASFRAEVSGSARRALVLGGQDAWLASLAARFDWEAELTRVSATAAVVPEPDTR